MHQYRTGLFLSLDRIFYLYFRLHEPVFGYATGRSLVSRFEKDQSLSSSHAYD